ncbi:MAG TPA: GDSL-type esterase/lipase family protein [Candidatus Methylacidiphilales bacterium]|nr:GDSL-type esterase/lipase family protein [Candidatus Methylacidiphilales bacterium]
MKTVVCFGSSLTAGRVSFNYVELLRSRPGLAEYRLVNRGVDGDLAWNGLQRLGDVISERPDAVSILIGTNDVNATLTERNLLRYRAFNHLPVDPTIEWYEENLRAIVTRLKAEAGARVALLTLAVIGEDLGHEANRKIIQYNEVIRRVARDEKTACLPLHERMITYLREHEADRAGLPPPLAYRDGLINIGNAIALHANGLSWDDISRRNGLLLTTDCLHLNSIGGGMIADLIENWLLTESAPDA